MQGNLSEDQRRILAGYLRLYADRMELRDWTVAVSHQPQADADHAAEVELDIEQYRATVHFRQDIVDMPADEVRITLAHELAHCHTGRLRPMLDETLGDHLGATLGRVMGGILHVEVERWAEVVAQMVAPTLPAFTWGGPEQSPSEALPPQPSAGPWSAAGGPDNWTREAGQRMAQSNWDTALRQQQGGAGPESWPGQPPPDTAVPPEGGPGLEEG